jgi:hypothetical protein
MQELVIHPIRTPAQEAFSEKRVERCEQYFL